MTIRITNESISAVVRSYALAPLEGGNVVVWLELAPQHPKVVGAFGRRWSTGRERFCAFATKTPTKLTRRAASTGATSAKR